MSNARRAGHGAVLVACTVLCLVACAGLLVYGSGRGFDLTDEVFYLVWTRDPRAYALTYQPFGYLLHPLFRLAGEDLQTYRLLGVAAIASAGAFVGSTLADRGRGTALLAIYGAAAALTVFFPWILTPSYNSAANFGALLILGGALRMLRGTPRSMIVGALATGAGLCAAAFAKPPLFALAVLIVALIAWRFPKTRLSVIAALAIAAALMSLLVPPPELLDLVRRILATQQILHLPNSVSGLPAKVARDWLAVPWVLSLAAVAAAGGALLPPARLSRALGYAAMLLTLSYAPRVVIDLTDGDTPDFLGLALITLSAGYAATLPRPPLLERLVQAALLGAPVAVALGTFNNQWGQLNYSMAFPLLALFVTASGDPVAWRGRLASGFALVAPVAVLVLAAARPYSLPASIFEQQIPIAPPVARGAILVDQETADFVRGARGLAAGAPLIDLSGTGPGVGVVLGARSPVLPWLNPATPTWPDVVWARMPAGAREQASFVVPVWPGFRGTQPARWLAARQDRYCRQDLPEMPFWGEERTLQLLRPCSQVTAPRGPAPPGR